MAALPLISWSDLRSKIQAGQAELVVTGVPRGSGARIGIDRDLDGVRDGDEGVEIYGQGTAGCAGVPALRASSEPRIGNPWFSLAATNARANALGILGIAGGKANVKLLGVDVLIDIGNPATLYLQVFADARGGSAMPLPIPDDRSLIGLQIFSQSLWVDSCGPQGVSATQGLGVTVTAR